MRFRMVIAPVPFAHSFVIKRGADTTVTDSGVIGWILAR
jgi:hypothetical protein